MQRFAGITFIFFFFRYFNVSDMPLSQVQKTLAALEAQRDRLEKLVDAAAAQPSPEAAMARLVQVPCKRKQKNKKKTKKKNKAKQIKQKPKKVDPPFRSAFMANFISFS